VVAAYILIQTEVGKAAQVAKDIVEIKGVQQAEAVTGPYDVIVRAEARNLDELGKLVVARVQAVDGITRTLTCPVVHPVALLDQPSADSNSDSGWGNAAVGTERLHWRRPGHRRIRMALNCEKQGLKAGARTGGFRFPRVGALLFRVTPDER
jgi:hypothetical protein